MSDLWPVLRVAQHLGVSKKRVYQLIESGQLESVKLSAHGLRVLRPSVDAYIEGLKVRRVSELGLDMPKPQGRRRVV